MGYFRKFYSSSKSLSYAFPPRTTIVGLLAGILGRDRNHYYDEFSDGNCKVALAVKCPVRKIVQPVNYLDTDEISLKSLSGFKRRVPTTSEFVIPEPSSGRLKYRIYLNHKDEEIIEELKQSIRSKRFKYPPSLGSANFIAEIKYVDDIDAASFSADAVCEREVEVFTVIPKSLIASLAPKERTKIHLEEAVPADFSKGRRIERVEDYVFEGSGIPLSITVGKSVHGKIGFKYPVNGDKYGVFM